MRLDEYPAMVAASKAAYARDMAVHGGLPPDVAHQKAETDFATILPDGLSTTGHAIFVIEVDQQRAHSRGLNRIELNLFGGNEVARGLYRSLGYRESAVQMTKNLG
jgi:hypothetical protein